MVPFSIADIDIGASAAHEGDIHRQNVYAGLLRRRGQPVILPSSALEVLKIRCHGQFP